jgi:hypothetical protein
MRLAEHADAWGDEKCIKKFGGKPKEKTALGKSPYLFHPVNCEVK